MSFARSMIAVRMIVTGIALFGAQAAAAQAGSSQQVPSPQPAASAASSSMGAQPSTASPGDDSATTFRVNVKLVNVFATVTDSTGTPVASLKQEDFLIFEDELPQKIAVFHRESELPLSIALAIDTSLSTRSDQKLELESARRFAKAILRPIDGVSLFEFSEIVDQLTPFTSDLHVIDKGISRIRTGAATALYDMLYLGSDALMQRRGRKVMVVITDGGDTMSKVTYQEAVREAQEAEVIVYSIIVVPIENSAGRDIGGEHALIQLSHDTGGKYYYASGLEQLDGAFRKISDELRTQYLIAYYPTQHLSSSEFRKIDIKIVARTPDYSNPAELTVRHRTGYYSMPSK